MAAFATVCFLLLAVTACKKTTAPTTIEAKQSRLDWNLKTTVGAYQEIGNTDPKWDEPVTNALAEFAASRSRSFAPDEDWATIIRTNCDMAVKTGCDDPMIRYLYIKFSMSQTNNPKDFSDAFCRMADDMEQSSYPDIRKFYAALRTAQQLKFAAGDITNTPPEVHKYRRLAMTNLANSLDDNLMPIGEVDDACNEMLGELEQNQKQYEDCYNLIENSLFKNWPDESAVCLLKGEAYIKKAWFARGGGYANTVTEEGAKTFAADLAIAEQALNRAWKLNPKDPRIAVKMMSVELGQGQGRERMELWFNRAMELNPNDYDACSAKLFYLEPKWYGSANDMLNFGRECVQSTNWGGRIPLILIDAHSSLCGYIDKSEQTNYWKQPDVWADIKSAYEKFFELNPNAAGYHAYYAWYAYYAEDWDTLNQLIPKLEPNDYNLFGGKNEFGKIVQLAKENASKPK